VQVRDADERDIEAVCALLEAAFRRVQEAQLFRALWEGDDLAAALVAVGPVAKVSDPGANQGMPSPPGLLLEPRERPRWRPSPASGTPSAAGETDPPVLGVAVLAHLLSPKGAVGLGPLAVRRDCRDRGVGKALIGASVERARRDGHRAIFVLGQPVYYTRFGFSVEAAGPFRSEYPPEFLMALELKDGGLDDGGELRYPPAYAGL
jgi:putative acetyltransferase